MDFPGYSIICEIGRGGMATVYRARQVLLDREVALKVLSPNLAADPANAQRFLQEARMLASLEHPHVVPVYEVGVTPDGSYYFSMQLLENGDFNSRLQRGVSEAELVRVLTAIADALAYAHTRGYVHRDVTPSNVLFDAEDKPRLTDFGIARAMAVTSRITASGLSVGTSHYMSPEQARGGEVDPRSDIYSLGVLCYEALTGHPPFRGADSFAVAYAHVYEPVPPLPPALAKWQPLIDRCMAKNPTDRFQDCLAFIASLQRIAFSGRAPEPAASAAPGLPVDQTPTVRTSHRADPAASAAAQVAEPMLPAAAVLERRWIGPLLGLVGMLAVISLFALWVGWGPRGGDSASASQDAAPDVWSADQSDPMADLDMSADGDDPAASELAAGAGDSAILQTVADPVPVLLALAQRDISQRRYSAPAGRNALERYQLVQRIDPGNREARAGIERVAAVYLQFADEHAGDQDPSLWLGYLQRAEELAQEFKVETVANEAAQRRQARLTRILADAEAALARWDRDGAVLAYEQALAVAPDAGAVKNGLARARRLGRNGFVFHDRLERGNGPEMIIVNRLGFSRAPVTVGEFRAYWDAQGASRFGASLPSCRDRESAFRSSRRRTFLEPGFSQGDAHPVVCVSVTMADDYARWLSRVSGTIYRLPSSAELRAAGVGVARDCSGGNIRDETYRDEFGGRGDHANCRDGYATTSPVNAFKPAGNGLLDAVGNVREWSEDCVGNGCRERRTVGGSWASSPGEEPERAFPADTGFNTIGFRVVRTIPQ